MVVADQAVDIHRSQLDLVALRLPQTRRADRGSMRLRLLCSGSSPNSSLPAIVASCESVIEVIEANHSRGEARYYHRKFSKDLQPLRRAPCRANSAVVPAPDQVGGGSGGDP